MSNDVASTNAKTFCNRFAYRMSKHIPEAGNETQIFSKIYGKLKHISVADDLIIYGWDGHDTILFDREAIKDVRNRMHEGMHAWGYNDGDFIGLSRLSDGQGYYTNEAIANALVSRTCPEFPHTNRGINNRIYTNILTYKEITSIGDMLIKFQGLDSIIKSFRDDPRGFEASLCDKFAEGFFPDFITAMDNLGEIAETRNNLKDLLSLELAKTSLLNKLRGPLREMLNEHYEGTMGLLFHGYYSKQFEIARGNSDKTAQLVAEVKSYPDDLCQYINLLKDGVSLRDILVPPVSRGFLRATPENAPKDVQKFYDGIITPRKALLR